MERNWIVKAFLVLFSCFSVGVSAQLDAYRWVELNSKTTPVGRHENGFVEFQDQFYLLGGRGVKSVDVYDPHRNTWEHRKKTPMEMHHFQALVYGEVIYIVGAMTGKYPKELPLKHIWKYYPKTDTWEKGAEIPERRRRGGAGAVVYKDKIYMAGGIKYGHTSGTCNYFDAFDLKTQQWQELTDAPHIRDHFPAIVVDNKMYCVGGRNTSVHYPQNFTAFFSATIPQVDYYDLIEERWYTLRAPLPYPTAAGGLVALGQCLIYMGGEGSQLQAYNQCQCLDVKTGQWTQLSPLYTGRHGTGAIRYKNEIYIAAGSDQRGGANITSMEKFTLNHQWQKLFDGESLAGWDVKCTEQDKDQTFWRVKDGAIECQSLDSKEHHYVWLQTEKEYRDFVLRLKFQVARSNKGNSGVQVRSRYDDTAVVEQNIHGWLDGPQVDIHPQEPYRTGLIYDETRSEKRWLYPDMPNAKISPESIKHKVRFYYEDEETGWNDMTIICKGTHIKTLVNNAVVAEYDGADVLTSKVHQKLKVGMEGHIALQLHKKARNLIRFKDIEIQTVE